MSVIRVWVGAVIVVAFLAAVLAASGGEPATASSKAAGAGSAQVPPTISVTKTASPLTRPEPGGSFTFTVVVTNTSSETATITSLTDDVYGNLATRPSSTCNTAIGTVLATNGSSYACSFSGNFAGVAGNSQTDTVTGMAVDAEGNTVSDTDTATVSIAPVTSVKLLTFSARRSKSGVVLAWRTASENDILGFNVYRQEGAKRVKLNRRLIVAKGTGALYSFAHRVPRAARLPTRLWLQVVNGDGSRNWFGAGSYCSELATSTGPASPGVSVHGHWASADEHRAERVGPGASTGVRRG